jgi:hypothetical protein
MYSFGKPDFLNVLATARSVFPDAIVVRISAGDAMVVACRDGPVLPAAGFAAIAQARVDSVPEVRGDLMRWFGTASVPRLLTSRLLIGRDAAGALCGSNATVVTDRNLRLEYDTPLRVFGGFVNERAVDPMLLDAVSAEWLLAVHASVGDSQDAQDGLLELWTDAFACGCRAGQGTISEAWQKIAPKDVRGWVRRVLSVSKVSADAVKVVAETAIAKSRTEAEFLATGLRDQGRAEEAAAAYRVLVAKFPGDAESRYGLALVLSRAGLRDEARAAFEAAVAADPLDPVRGGIERELAPAK